MNESGETVGWILDDATGTTKAFYIDPADGGSFTVLPNVLRGGVPSFEETVAYAISTPEAGKPLVIAGYGIDTAVGAPAREAVYWMIDGGGRWQIRLVLANQRGFSEATGANGNAFASGWVEMNSVKRIFRFDVLNPTITLRARGLGTDINTDGPADGMIAGAVGDPATSTEAVVIYDDALEDLHTMTGKPQSLATAVNDDEFVVGWAGAGPGSHSPALWVFDDLNTTWSYIEIFPLPSANESARATDINEADENGRREIVGFYEAGSTGAFYIRLAADPQMGGNTVVDLDDLVFLPRGGGTDRAYAINDNGWIAGSYRKSPADLPRPCLYIPYNLNNNFAPANPAAPRTDIREILDGDGPDTNGNWVIDWAENIGGAGMRPGLYATGKTASGNRSNLVDNVQVVRLHLNQNLIHLVVTEERIFRETLDALNFYGRGIGANEKKEIIIMVRTVRPGDPPSFQDYVPTPSEQEEMIADILHFASVFAECIDYLQFGNEIFTGPGEYWVSLPGCGPNGFEGLLRDVPGDCVPEATALVYGWLGEQIEAARRASALAGRPLRFISPALTMGNVILAEFGDVTGDLNAIENRAAFSAKANIEFGNEVAGLTDLHLHYTSINDIPGKGVPGMTEIVDLYTNPPDDWHVKAPIFVTSTEWGPVPRRNEGPPEPTWWEVNKGNLRLHKYYKAFMDDPPPEDPLWDGLLAEWLGADELPADGGDVDTLNKLAESGFMVACYGNYTHGPPFMSHDDVSPRSFDLAVPHASKIKKDWLDPNGKGFSIMRTFYENAAALHLIHPFDPHPRACTVTRSTADNK